MVRPRTASDLANDAWTTDHGNMDQLDSLSSFFTGAGDGPIEELAARVREAFARGERCHVVPMEKANGENAQVRPEAGPRLDHVRDT